MGKYLDLAEKAQKTAVYGHSDASRPGDAEEREFQGTGYERNELNEINPSNTSVEDDRVRVLVLLSEPYPGEPDNDDPEEGQHIIAAVEAVGGWIRIEHERIVLRWRGDFPGRIIDQITAARTAVVFAAAYSTPPSPHLPHIGRNR